MKPFLSAFIPLVFLLRVDIAAASEVGCDFSLDAATPPKSARNVEITEDLSQNRTYTASLAGGEILMAR